LLKPTLRGVVSLIGEVFWFAPAEALVERLAEHVILVRIGVPRKDCPIQIGKRVVVVVRLLNVRIHDLVPVLLEKCNELVVLQKERLEISFIHSVGCHWIGSLERIKVGEQWDRNLAISPC